MKTAVLADTGPLYAAVDPDDQYHRRAQTQLERLERDRFTVLLLYPTLLEAYTLVLYRLGAPTARKWLRNLSSGASSINPTPEDYRAAVATVDSYPDQSITLFDATVAIVGARLDLTIWTYDHHFDVLGASVWR